MNRVILSTCAVLICTISALNEVSGAGYNIDVQNVLDSIAKVYKLIYMYIYIFICMYVYVLACDLIYM